jgi:hypothetical protein
MIPRVWVRSCAADDAAPCGLHGCSDPAPLSSSKTRCDTPAVSTWAMPPPSCDPIIRLPLWERWGFGLDQLPEATWGKATGSASLPSSRLATKAACVRFLALSFFRMLRT